MYYEPYRRKKRGRARGCLARITRIILFAAVLYAVIAIAVGFLKNIRISGGGEALAVNTNLPGGWTNILLLGSDLDDAGGSRTDTMLIASISDGGRVKLTSLMRDTQVSIDGYGKAKLNAAYRYGGAELAMKTVNQAFGMNITKYVVVDFRGFPQLIDAVGGIELDINKAERDEINKNMRHAVRALGGKPSDVVELEEYGENTHLNGQQALGYARIRNLDSDYMRAARQRNVLDALLSKVRTVRSPIRLAGLMNAALQNTQMNISFVELMGVAGRVLASGDDMQQYRVPVEGTYKSGTKNGVWSIEPDLVENQKKLITFIYGT